MHAIFKEYKGIQSLLGRPNELDTDLSNDATDQALAMLSTELLSIAERLRHVRRLSVNVRQVLEKREVAQA